MAIGAGQVHRIVPLLLLAVTLVGCSALADTTTDFAVGDPAGEYTWFQPGQTVWAGTSSFKLSPGSDAELLSVDALGLPAGTDATPLVANIGQAQMELGLFTVGDVPPSSRAAAKPMAGTVITPESDWNQVILTFQMPNSEVSIHGYRLTYRRDGATRTAFIPYSDHICLDRAQDCPFIEPHH